MSSPEENGLSVMGGDVGESLLETVGMKEGTGPRFSRGGCSDLEGEAAENTKRRAGGHSGGGRSSESKECEVAQVGCAERDWVATECIWVASPLSYEREHIRFVLFTYAVSADLVGLIMSAPIWLGPGLPLLRISFSRIGMTKASVFSLHHHVLVLHGQ